MNTKILFEFNIQSITDIITNSSSELFVFKNRELEDLVLILSLIHPCWNLEYNEPIQVNRMRDDELVTYLEWVYGGSDFDYEIRNIPITKENTKRTGVAKHFGLKPKFVYEDYENWDPNINKLSLKYLPEGLTLPKKHIFVYHGDSLDIIAKNRVTISDEDKRLNIEKSRECRGYTVDVYNMSGELVDVVKGLEAASEKYGMISHNISKQMREKINGKGPYTFRHHNDFSVYVYSIYNNNDLLYRSFSKKCIREYLSKNKIRLGQAFSRLISESLTSISKYTYQIKYEIAHTGSNSGIESRQSEEINSEVSNEANGET